MSGCAQTVGPVVWSYQFFQQRYPDLARWVSPEMGQMYFDLATLYLDNSDGGSPAYINSCGCCVGSRAVGSPVRNIPQRQILLGLLTAHIASLNAPLNGQPSPSLVGRVGSATEGSVSVSMEYPQVAGADWFGLTKYGIMFFGMTAAYRTARYIPGPQYQRPMRYGWGRF
jgi:hypothetical protein